MIDVTDYSVTSEGVVQYKGSQVGGLKNDGHIRVLHLEGSVKASSIVWQLEHNEYRDDLEHIDNNKCNTRLENLK